MKRKRFIKLCMAEGMSRNEARCDAELVAWDNENAAYRNKCLKADESALRCSALSYVHMAIGFMRYDEKTEERIQARYMRSYE